MKKMFVMIIAAVVIGMTVVPIVSAQTRQQQQELEQIAKRSTKGLSAQDRARVVQIMTDVYVAQGMSRQQAAQFAQMAADTMFTTDIGEMTPEQRRQFEAEERRIAELEQRQQQPQQQNENWPSASLFQRLGISIARPSTNHEIIWWQEGDEEVQIQFTKQGRQNFTQAEVRDICRFFENAFGTTFPPRGLYSGQIWRDRVITDRKIQTSIPHPQRRTHNTMLEVEWRPDNMVTAHIWLVLRIDGN